MPLSIQTFASVKEAEAALTSDGARYLGGGTLVVRAVNEGDLSIGAFVRTTDASLGRITIGGDDVTLGAAATMAQIERRKELAPIARAARAVGGPAIRNMATVGGNLFAPAPYGDFAVALLALGASVDVDGGSMSLDEFLATRRDAKAVVTAVRFKLPAPQTFRFAKVSRTRPKGISVLSIGAALEQQPDGSISSARIALGCMSDRPIRARSAETALIGARLTEAGIAKAVAAIGDGTEPITDPIASAWYRREVLPVHFRRLLLS